MIESSVTRPLRLRIRPDLEIRSPGSSREKVWILRDPVTLKYYRLIREEYEVVRLLDGEHSLADMQNYFNATFSPLRLGMERLTAFLSRLYGEGLLLADSPNQADPLNLRRKKNRIETALPNGRIRSPFAVQASPREPFWRM